MNYPVHKSLMQPDLLLGIPKSMVIIILCLTLILVYMINIWFALFAVVAYIPAYFISKRDPELINILLDSLMQSDFLSAE